MRLTILLLALFAAPVVVKAVTIDLVPIGNPANPADVQAMFSAGRVDYAFELGKYEVTNSQYVDFLNAVDPAGANTLGLYNDQMSSSSRGGVNFSAAAASGQKYAVKAGRATNPVVFVSFYDAARFTNWLQNGQGNGNTEDGAYELSGGTPIPGNGEALTRKVTAAWCLPNFDEWYKAAYHKNDGVTNHYWDYATASDAIPTSDQPPGVAPNQANSANFKRDDNLANGINDGYAVTGSSALVAGTNYLTNVGAYTIADSAYGTFDQNGNVWEWTDTSLGIFPARLIGGGSWFNEAPLLASDSQSNTQSSGEFDTIGFRVARVPPGALPGDYNGNGTVDAADYAIWRNTLGSTTDLRADGDDTGDSHLIIDQADYDFWKANFGETTGTAAVATHSVPEPATLMLMFSVLTFSSACRNRSLTL
jgi:formylglycine-generating enzyme required for sulfatase activity